MGKPYSLDLRKRVASAIEGGMSRNRAAKQFGVAISTAIGWMQRLEETGSVEPARWAVASRRLELVICQGPDILVSDTGG